MLNNGSIEEDIKRLNEIIKKCDVCNFLICDQCEINWKEVQSIKTVLSNLDALCNMQMAADKELKKAREINKEHQKINEELREKVKELKNTIKKISKSSSNNEKLIEKFYKGEAFTSNQIVLIEKFFIPKQKIKDKIEEIKEDKESKYYYNFLEERDIEKVVQILEEILQKSEDK